MAPIAAVYANYINAGEKSVASQFLKNYYLCEDLEQFKQKLNELIKRKRMKIDWNEFLGKTLNVTLVENYGLVKDSSNNTPLYEIVFKTGKLINAYDDGLLLETEREKQLIKIFVSYQYIKCVEIFNL